MKKTKLTGRIVTHEDCAYETSRTNLNLSIQKFPCIPPLKNKKEER